jgi:hypothetical protein
MLKSALAGLQSADAFLDTIPEEEPVAPYRMQTLSAASAVASSDTDDNNSNKNNVLEGQTTKKRRRKGPASVTSSNFAIIDTTDAQEESNRKDENGGKIGPSFCTKRWTLYGLVVLGVLAGISVGAYFIATNANGRFDEPSMSPTSDSTFPPIIYLEMDSDFPTQSPELSEDESEAIDDVLLQVSSAEDYLNPKTPQGRCRLWIKEEDSFKMRVSTVGEGPIVQRYVICVLYYAMNGVEWVNTTASPLDPNLHECDAIHVGCRKETREVVWLDMEAVNLQGSIPTEIIQLSALNALDFSENRIVGRIPQGLLELEKLSSIDLSSNALTGTIPSITTPTGSYSPLEFLVLDDNLLSGTLPLFATLRRLKVEKNLFTGFDPGYPELTSLQSWTMWGNKIRGSLPDSWDAPSLSHLDLALNAWTGTIPESLWNLPSMRSLVLHDASLTGSLPESVVSQHWKYLLLYSNQLVGSIPQSLTVGWDNVTQILLHNNSLTGSIPEDSCSQWPLIEVLETDCLRDNLTCSCCTKCHP